MPDDIAPASTAAPIGHNAPDPAEALRDTLEAENQSLLARKVELLEGVDRMPAEIADEDAANRATQMGSLIAAAHKRAEAMRVDRKEPYLKLERTVDGFFKTQLLDPLSTAKKKVEGLLNAYQRRKAERERQERLERERLAREEAERARAAAQAAERAAQTERDLNEAIAAQERADQATAQAVTATKEAAAKPAELGKVRSDIGSLATLRSVWTFADLDRDAIDLEKLRPYLATDSLEKAVRGFIRAMGGDSLRTATAGDAQPIRGVRIYEDAQTVIR